MKYNIWNEERIPLTECLDFIVDNRGKTVPTADEGIKLIATNCILNNSLYPVYEKIRYVSQDTYDNWFRSHPMPGDIIFVNKGTPGKVCLVPEVIDFCFAQDMMAFRTKKEIYNKYLFAILRSSIIQNQIANSTVGTLIPHFKKEQLKDIYIPIVNHDVQKKIGDIYFKLCQKIELNKEINKNLHDLAEQQFNKIYSRGTPKKLNELLFNVSTGSRPKGGAQESGIPSIGAEKIEKFGVYDYSTEKYISEDYYKTLKNGKLKNGDVLLYKDGAYTGKVSMCLNGFPHNKAAVNEHVFILNTENNWAQNYLYFTLYNKDNKETIHRLASSKAAQPGLNQAELKSIEVNICNKEDIITFENNIKPIVEKIALNSLENKKLAELRDILMPKIMNGEIDLDKIEI